LIIFIPKRSAQRRADDLAASGLNTKVPNITSWRGLIDPDTPQAALTSKSIEDGSDYVLVFSDEFNVEGRSFYPGDDPFWEGVNLHYWQTNNLEWYDPKQITTRNGSVEFRLEKVDDITKNYNMSYSGGMMATWNRVRLSPR
jgi:beta-glucanase (GH16 family)